MRYRFELATPADDPGLRRILRETPMDGELSVTFQREPSFFSGSTVEGPFRQIIVCRETGNDEIVGFGTRSIREMHVNGSAVPIGYLGSLRILESHRSRGLVARGFRYLRELHMDQRTDFYLTTIAEGNDRALATLTSARAGLPRYDFAGTIETIAIPIRRTRQPRQPRRARRANDEAISIRSATRNDIPAIVAFLNEEGRRHQFFPKYQADDFRHLDGILKDLDLEDLMLAFDQTGLIGTLAGWNQRGYRQTIINRYSPPLSWLRPFYNGWATLTGGPPLPSPAKAFRYASAALPLVQDGRPEVFAALLDRLLLQLADRETDYLLIGFHESNSLLPHAKHRGLASYLTRLYHVCWSESGQLRERLDERPTYLELGSL